MKISLLSPDSKMPNLALMKLSAWHKLNGDTVELNFPLMPSDMTYASILFDWSDIPSADIIGGPRFSDSHLEPEIEALKPDYELYPSMDYSLGYTYRACPRSCDFCIVPKQHNLEIHNSIWSFHDPRFKKICLLNNNTLADHRWRETFEEIIDAGLTLMEHGLDARLITEESACYLGCLNFEGYLHTAWDYPEHESEVLRGLCLLRKTVRRIMCYVLIGHTTHEENYHRVQILQALGIDPFVMPLNKQDDYQKRFARWVNHKAVFKTVRWEDYK